MDYDKLPTFGEIDDDEDEPQSLIDRGVHPTESIDLKGLMDELDHPSVSADETKIKETSLGRLMEALPIPVLLIDPSRNIIFANQSCEKISSEYKKIVGISFQLLFPNVNDAKTAQSMIEQVFESRKTQILEGLLKIEDKQIWGRAHIRCLKLDHQVAILVLIEDLTLEKSQLRIQQKVRKELEKRVEQRTADLAKTNEQLQMEIDERKRVEGEITKHRAHLRELVAERTTELNSTIKRLKKEIKERLQVEESLRSSQRRFNVAFRANPGLVTISTVNEGKYLEVNDSFCRTSGYARHEVIGRTEDEVRFWARPSHREQMVRVLLKKGPVHDFQALFRAKNGKPIMGSLSAELIELDGLSYVLTTTIDITKRKQAEADRTLMTAAIEQTAEAILITDPSGIIQYVNPAVEAISGYARAEILCQNISMLRSSANDQAVFQKIRERLDQGQPWQGRLINKKKDGSRHEVEATISPVKGPSGRIIACVAVEHDVTGEVRLEKQLRQAHKMEAIGTMAGGIAHDFNNILMAIMGFTQLAKDQLPEESAEVSDLNEVLTACERAKDLINQILTFSRHGEQQYRSVDVRLIFKEAVKLLRASIPSTVDMRLDLDHPVGSVFADPTQMHQLIMNLCMNAYQAMQGRHGVLSLKLSQEALDAESAELDPPDLEPGKYVKLTVSDTGHGMTSDILERIFEPYFTTKSLSEGTGLGLALVHGIVTSHGGGITVQSEPGLGTTVTVYLPRCYDEAESEREEVTAGKFGAGRILFVDDEYQIAGLGKRILECRGYHVEPFTDAMEALEAFRKRPGEFDLVVTDLTMPKMTGQELAKEMMAIRPDIPMIMCTGFGETLAIERARELGIRDFLVKPVTPGFLGKAVRKALANPLGTPRVTT